MHCGGVGIKWWWRDGDEDMHPLANRCGASVCVDGTGYITGALTMKGMTLITTLCVCFRLLFFLTFYNFFITFL